MDVSNEEVIDLPPKEPGKGSSWRRENWLFNQSISQELNSKQIVLEIGCGRGYFKPLFCDNYIGTDIDLRQAADFVCDLTQQSCLQDESVDVILLNNVLEHVYEYSSLLNNAARALKKGGIMVITVPYSSIELQINYFRFSHYCLMKIMGELGMTIEKFEAVYRPYTQLKRSHDRMIRSMTNGTRNFLARVILRASGKLLVVSKKVSKNLDPEGIVSLLNLELNELTTSYKSPLGYQIKAIKI